MTVRAVRRVLGLFAVAILGACGGGAAAKDPAPVVLVVYVDGVAGTDVLEQWSSALGPDTRTALLVPVSTSAPAALLSAELGLEPPEHGVMTAFDAYQVVPAPSAFDDSGALVRTHGVTNLRVVSAETQKCSWWPTHVATRDVGQLFRRAREELHAWRDVDGELAGIGAHRIDVVVAEPNVRAPWPAGLPEDVASLRSELADDSLPASTDLDAWYTRELRARYPERLDEAFRRAWHRDLAGQVAEFAHALEDDFDNWCVVLCGLRSASLARGEVDLDERLPLAVVASAGVGDLPQELRDVASFVDARLGRERAHAARAPSQGLWRGTELVGERAAWRRIERDGLALVAPPVSGLALRLAADAAAVRAVIHGAEAGAILGATEDGSDRVVAPQRGRVEFELAPGSTWHVHTRTRTEELLLELSRNGVALDPDTVAVGPRDLREADLARVVDARGRELGADEVSRRIAIRRQLKGWLEILAPGPGPPGAGAAARLQRWPPADEPVAFELVEGRRVARFEGPGRIAVLLPLADARPTEQPTGQRAGQRAGHPTVRYAFAREIAVDGRASSTDALRLLWPGRVLGRADAEATGRGWDVPPAKLRLDAIGPTLLGAAFDERSAAFLSTLKDFE